MPLEASVMGGCSGTDNVGGGDRASSTPLAGCWWWRSSGDLVGHTGASDGRGGATVHRRHGPPCPWWSKCVDRWWPPRGTSRRSGGQQRRPGAHGGAVEVWWRPAKWRWSAGFRRGGSGGRRAKMPRRTAADVEVEVEARRRTSRWRSALPARWKRRSGDGARWGTTTALPATALSTFPGPGSCSAFALTKRKGRRR
jgi:hypothetical protein